MTNHANHSVNPQIDPAFVAQIVRKVIARLKETNSQQTTKTEVTAASIADQVVTARTIENIPGTPSQIFVAPRSVVTPAAFDAAKQRAIEITRTNEVPPAQRPQRTRHDDAQEIIDRDKPERATAVAAQLARRGITGLGCKTVVLSDAPAAEVHRCISTRSCRAVMVAALADVDRFHGELTPDVWVLDMGRLNLMAAVNIAARISQLEN